MKRFNFLLALLLISTSMYGISPDPVKFGNAVYVNLSEGDQFEYKGKTIQLLELENHRSLIKVNDSQAWLEVARRSLPELLGGLRIFVSDWFV